MQPAGGAPGADPPGTPSIGPQVSLSLDPPTREANVSDREFGVAAFNGTAEIDKLPGTRVVVTLSASTDTGWGCSCSPSIIAFSTNNVEVFTVTVTVPPGTLASLLGILTVNASATGTGFSTSSSANATVTVQPYYQLRLQCESPYLNISAGGNGKFRVKIENRGNANDSYDIVIGNAEELRRAGWAVSISRPSIPFVGPGASMHFYVVVESPRSLPTGSEPASIEVKVTSTGSKTPGPVQSSDIVLYAKVRGGIGDPLNQTMIIVVVIAVVVVAALAWRRRKKRSGHAVDVEEAPPT